jgi:Mn-containing catalase
MEKPPFSIGLIAPTPGLVDEFFNDSTGGGEEEESVPTEIVEHAGLHVVNSPLFDGDGLNVSPTEPVPGSEVTSPADSTPVGVGAESRFRKGNGSKRPAKKAS